MRGNAAEVGGYDPQINLMCAGRTINRSLGACISVRTAWLLGAQLWARRACFTIGVMWLVSEVSMTPYMGPMATACRTSSINSRRLGTLQQPITEAQLRQCPSTGSVTVSTIKSPSSSNLALPSFMPVCVLPLPSWMKAPLLEVASA